jgi:hypothetical protein
MSRARARIAELAEVYLLTDTDTDTGKTQTQTQARTQARTRTGTGTGTGTQAPSASDVYLPRGWVGWATRSKVTRDITLVARAWG